MYCFMYSLHSPNQAKSAAVKCVASPVYTLVIDGKTAKKRRFACDGFDVGSSSECHYREEEGSVKAIPARSRPYFKVSHMRIHAFSN